MTLLLLAEHFPDIAKQVCFHPAVSTFHSVVCGVPSSKRKVAPWFNKKDVAERVQHLLSA